MEGSNSLLKKQHSFCSILNKCRYLLKMNELLYESFDSDNVEQCDLRLQCRPDSVIKHRAFNSVLRKRSEPGDSLRSHIIIIDALTDDNGVLWDIEMLLQLMTKKEKKSQLQICLCFAKENVYFPIVLNHTLRQNGRKSCNLYFQKAKPGDCGRQPRFKESWPQSRETSFHVQCFTVSTAVLYGPSGTRILRHSV